MLDRDTALAAALAAVLGVMYGAAACPTIYVGDSGELVTAVHVLGIPHPTGYPLYVLLGKLWTLLVPVGSIAYRMSLFSAACAALACGVLYRLCRDMELHRAAALLAALLLAFSPSFWGEANVQRVYALNAVFVVMATAAAFRWYRARSARNLAWAFFVCGLGATNHTFMALFAVALGVWVLLLGGFRHWGAAAGAFALGLLPYVYLPLRSRMNPPLDWGNPETLSAFLAVVLRRGFWVRAWIETPKDVVAIIIDYLHSLGVELLWAGTALAVLGVAAALADARRRRLVLLPLLVMGANLAALAAHGSRSDLFIWHRYYIPSYAMAALLAGVGCHVLLAHLPRPFAVLPLVIPVVLLVRGWRDFDRSCYRIAEDFAYAVLRSLPPGAHLIATDDNILFALIYLQMVEQRRPDVDLILEGVGGADLPPLRFNPESEPVYFTHHPNWNVPALQIMPIGVVFRTQRPGAVQLAPVLPTLRLVGEDDPDVPKDYLTQNLIGHFHYMLGVTFEERDWLRARREFAMAVAASPSNEVLFYNLGLIFRRNGLVDDAIAAFQSAHAINPRHLPSLSAPRAADRIDELRTEQQRVLHGEAALSAMVGVAAPTPAYHRHLAALLEARGEPIAARGHRLQALEIEAGLR